MKIVFLGTGGGRWSLISQRRKTGGIRINGSLNLHIDPGPGAILCSHMFSQEPRSIDALVVTHNHIDHVNDAGVLIEAMTTGKKGKNGWLIGSKGVIFGDENGDRGIAAYHQERMAKVIAAKPGDRIEIRTEKGSASLLACKVKHQERSGFGMVLEMDGVKMGYTSDTEYFPGISDQYLACDILIANNLKTKDDGVPGHLYTEVTAMLFSEARPRLGVITHFGTWLLDSGPDKEARKIERISGVKTIAAKDGLKVDAASLKLSMIRMKLR